MKKIFILFSLLTALSITSFAQSAFDKEVERSLELQHQRDIFKQSMTQTMSVLYQQKNIDASKLNAAIDEITDACVPELTKTMKELYKQHFTLEELKQINDFLATPVGQKQLKLAPTFAVAGMQAMQNPDIQAKIVEIAKKHFDK